MPPPGPSPPFKHSLPNLLTIARLVLAVAMFVVLTFWNYEDSRLAQRGSGGAAVGSALPDPWLILAAVLFFVAAVTDALDGYLARKWNVVSVFGRIMDPFADKLLVIGAFVFLAGSGFWWSSAPVGVTRVAGASGDATAADADIFWHLAGVQVSGVFPWMVAVILGRELLVTSIRGVMEAQGIAFPATASGKWKMILQSLAVPIVLVLIAFGGGAGVYGGPGVAGGDTPSAALAVMTSTIHILIWATVLVTAWSGVPYVLRAIEAARGRETPAAAPSETPPADTPGADA